MARILSTLLVLGLLGGTAAAFAITEGLKLEKSPISRTEMTKLFSPECRCRHDRARIAFRLRRSDSVTAAIVTGSGDTVATLTHRYFRRGRAGLTWNGRDDSGAVVPDGTYKLRLHLAKRHQTIVLPNTIEVDSTPPSITLASVRPPVISPNHDGRFDYATIRFRVSEPSRPLLYVDGRRVGRGRLERARGTLHWFGKAHGRPYPAGAYRLTLRAQDRAGNVSAATRPARIVIRFVAVGRSVVRVPAGKRFHLRVVADSKLVRWRLHGRTGKARPGTLVLRAPARPGRYRLLLTAVDHSRSAVVVAGRP